MATFQDDQLNGNGREISHVKQTFSHVSGPAGFAPRSRDRLPIFQSMATPSFFLLLSFIELSEWFTQLRRNGFDSSPAGFGSFLFLFYSFISPRLGAPKLRAETNWGTYLERPIDRPPFTLQRNERKFLVALTPGSTILFYVIGRSSREYAPRTPGSHTFYQRFLPLFLPLAGLACNLRVLTVARSRGPLVVFACAVCT